MSKPSITFLGHSGFLLEYQGSTLLIDPQNNAAGQRTGNIVYCSHNHWDHTGGVNSFLEENADAILLGNSQVATKFAQWEDRVTTVNPGDMIVRKPWAFEFIQLPHGFFKGKLNLGVIVRTTDFAIGHLGDAIRFDGRLRARLRRRPVRLLVRNVARVARVLERPRRRLGPPCQRLGRRHQHPERQQHAADHHCLHDAPLPFILESDVRDVVAR